MKQVEKATYVFNGEIDSKGNFKGSYSFSRPDLNMQRKKQIIKDIKKADHFPNQREPTCGLFKIRFYSWDLAMKDQKAVFGDTATYKELIRPNTGVKVFRDGFRVLPYGNDDNDWLGMDLERVRRFEDHLSRNQVIAAIEISSKDNPLLLDKTDREGLIDNEEFKDFRSLLKSAIVEFEAERLIDRQKLKAATGRLHDESYYRTTFSRNLAALSTLITSSKVDGEIKVQVQKLITDIREIFDRMLRKNEQPLLVAASIGLTFMMPTHEVQRDLHEALKLLRSMRDSGEISPAQIESVVSLVKQGHSVVSGLGKLMQQTDQEESFDLGKTASFALQLMQYKFSRNKIKTEIVAPSEIKVKGSSRLIAVVLLNFLDNSFYWLQKNKEDNRNIKVIATCEENECMLIVSDNGSGFEDDVDTVGLWDLRGTYDPHLIGPESYVLHEKVCDIDFALGGEHVSAQQQYRIASHVAPYYW